MSTTTGIDPFYANPTRIPTVEEIDKIIAVAKVLKEEGAFSTLPASQLAKRSGYRKRDIIDVLRRFDDIFLCVGGAYKLKTLRIYHSSIDRLAKDLRNQRNAYYLAIFIAILLPALLSTFIALINIH